MAFCNDQNKVVGIELTQFACPEQPDPHHDQNVYNCRFAGDTEHRQPVRAGEDFGEPCHKYAMR
jgi:hypothetical protein